MRPLGRRAYVEMADMENLITSQNTYKGTVLRACGVCGACNILQAPQIRLQIYQIFTALHSRVCFTKCSSCDTGIARCVL